MKLIVCLDDNKGMMFNRRRQSRDSAVVRRIQAMSREARLYMTEYSAKIFQNSENIALCDAVPWGEKGDFFFCEEGISRLDDFEEVYVFNWNRTYPWDVKFDFSLENEGFSLLTKEDFVGNSHDKITLEIYGRNRA